MILLFCIYALAGKVYRMIIFSAYSYVGRLKQSEIQPYLVVDNEILFECFILTSNNPRIYPEHFFLFWLKTRR